MGDWGAKKRERKSIAKNRRAFHEYEILETFEAGLELTGTEVRSLRENNCQLTDCFALIRGGEVWLHNVHIAPYSNGNIAHVDPDRKRKLLLHRREIRLVFQRKRPREGRASPCKGEENLRQAPGYRQARCPARD